MLELLDKSSLFLLRGKTNGCSCNNSNCCWPSHACRCRITAATERQPKRFVHLEEPPPCFLSVDLRRQQIPRGPPLAPAPLLLRRPFPCPVKAFDILLLLQMRCLRYLPLVVELQGVRLQAPLRLRDTKSLWNQRLL